MCKKLRRRLWTFLLCKAASYPACMSIRVAVIGYGFGGRIFHAPFVSAVPGLELVAIVQRTGDTAAAEYPHVRILRDPEEAFADPTIDLVVISTPNLTHFDLTRRALQAGKHVVIDKPFATNSGDALELVKLASALNEKAPRVLAPFHNRRFDSDFNTVRKLVAESTLGRVVTVEACYDRFRPLRRPNTWKETNGPINGLLFDLGPHLVDQALALFGAPDKVTASIRMDRDASEIDDALEIAFDYEGNDEGESDTPLHRRYTCRATMLAAEPAPRFSVRGTHGSFTKPGLDPQEAALLAGRRPPQIGSPERWLAEPESTWGTLTLATRREEPVQLESRKLESEDGDYRVFYANVRDAILGKAGLLVPPEDGYRVVRLLELARESSERGMTLPVKFAL